jgi:hypothetical protein
VLTFYSTESAIFVLMREGIPFEWNTKVSFQAQRRKRPGGVHAVIVSDHRFCAVVLMSTGMTRTGMSG